MKNNNAFGFSMIETGIALFVLSGVLLFVAQQTGQFNKVQMKANYDIEIEEASRKIEAALSDPTTCSSFVAGTTLGYIQPVTSAGNSGLGGTEGPRMGNAIGGEITAALIDPNVPPQTSPTNPSSGQVGPAPGTVAQTDQKISSQLKVNSIQLINDGFKNLIRVTFIPIGAASDGGMRINRDFIISGKKNASNQITSCSMATETATSLHCKNLVDSQWNAATQKCEVISRLKKARTLIKVYASPAGGMMTEHLVPNSIVKKCDCSGYRCSYRPNCFCNVGSCPSGQRIETPSRRVTVNQRIGKKCEMHAQCYNIIPIPPTTEPIGYILGP